MYINAAADSVMLYLRHNFITSVLYSFRVRPPPVPWKNYGCAPGPNCDINIDEVSSLSKRQELSLNSPSQNTSD